MAKVTITYTAVAAPAAPLQKQICATFVPTNAASDAPAFDGTYYDTNVEGFGEGMAITAFVEQSVAHPGLVLALKKAVKDGSYEFDETDAKEIAYLEEVAPALKPQGFVIAVAAETNGEG